MRDSIKEAAKVIGFIVGAMILLALITLAGEEKPHRVVVDGKEYIRSKEYVGNNHYQIIMIPVESSK
jgi:hypothetical protein